MSRTPQEKRLHLFGLGNDRCPICLTGFTEADVREGEAVELEHVPAKSLNAGGFAMCLTCADCNNRASKMEKVAAEMDRALDHGWKAQLTMEKGGIPPQTVYVTGDGPIANIKEYLDIGKTGPIRVRSKGLRVSEEKFSQALLRPDQTLRLQYSFDERYASVAWLKAAYLSVFSLLGKYGYRYAQGEAIEQVRGQIMEPNREILRHFLFSAPPEWQDEDGIAIARRERPCWAVKMKDRLVLLPRGWDASLHEWVESTMNEEGKLTLGGGSMWYSHRFGDMATGSISFREDADFLKRNDIFGCTGSQHHDGIKVPFVIVDRSTRHMTLLVAPRDSAAV